MELKEVNGSDFWTRIDVKTLFSKIGGSPSDDEYKKLCCEQCNRIWAAYAKKRRKSDKRPYCGSCMGHLLEEVLRVLTALEAPCRYCGDVPWVCFHDKEHVTVSCENDECAYYMSTDKDGGPLAEAEAIERWNWLNTGRQKEPRIKGYFFGDQFR